MNRDKSWLVVGLAFLISGIVCNQWALAWIFSKDHDIDDVAYLSLIWIFQFACICIGLIIVAARKEKLAGKLLLSAASCLVICPLVLEVGLRAAILSGSSTFRDPGLYADALADDDYWKLQTLWHDEDRLRTGSFVCQDPDLGWANRSSADNPLGCYAVYPASPQYEEAAILLYGDSFAEGFGVLEELLPSSVRDSLPYPVYNFGVSGYGVDQAFLRLKKTHGRFDRPKVLFGILTYDIDRCLLSFRSAPKPYFVIEGDDLQLRGVPTSASTRDWLRVHPPQISSFLGAFSSQQFKRHTQDFAEGPYRRDAKQQLAARVLEELEKYARQARLPMAVAVFYTPREFNYTGWREELLLEKCQSLGLEVIDTKPVLLDAAKREGREIASYYGQDDHLNRRGNEVVARALAERLAP